MNFFYVGKRKYGPTPQYWYQPSEFFFDGQKYVRMPPEWHPVNGRGCFRGGLVLTEQKGAIFMDKLNSEAATDNIQIVICI